VSDHHDIDRAEPFCPIPLRAVGDVRLSASHHRLLGAIAHHDRFGRNGIGCYASHRTLATEAAIHYTNVTRLIDDLSAWGYIQVGRHPLNRRLRIYALVYNANQAIVGGSTNNPTADAQDEGASETIVGESTNFKNPYSWWV
jgi:hypothetical protein